MKRINLSMSILLLLVTVSAVAIGETDFDMECIPVPSLYFSCDEVGGWMCHRLYNENGSRSETEASGCFICAKTDSLPSDMCIQSENGPCDFTPKNCGAREYSSCLLDIIATKWYCAPEGTSAGVCNYTDCS